MKHLKVILLTIFAGISGPYGVAYSYFYLMEHDGFSTVSTNVRVLKNMYIWDYLVISTSINLLIVLSISLLVWLIKGNKYSFRFPLLSVLKAHLAFLPIILMLLIFTTSEIEGNIMGFIFFPIYILLSLLGFIGFIFLLVKKLKDNKKEFKESESLKIELIKISPFLSIFFMALLWFSSFYFAGTTRIELISFDHNEFSWGISMEVQKRRTIDSNGNLFLFVKTVNNEIADIQYFALNDYLKESHHSLFSEFKNAFCINPILLADNETEDSNSFIESFQPAGRKDTTIRRLKYGNTLYIEKNQIELPVFKQIAFDFLNNFDQLSTLINAKSKKSFQELEAFVLLEGTIPVISHFRKEGTDIFLSVFPNGIVFNGLYQDEFINESSSDNLGKIREGVYYYDQEIYYGDADNTKFDFANYKNEAGLEFISTLKEFKDLVELKSNIKKAVEENYNAITLNLIDTSLQGIPEEIGHLQNLTSIHSKNYNIGAIPATFCALNSLDWIQFMHTKELSLPECFGEMQNIKYLELRDCGLRSFPKEILGIKNLIRLDLQENIISELPDELGEFHSLETISLSYTENLMFSKTLINGMTRDDFSLTIWTTNHLETEKANDLIKNLKGRTSFSVYQFK